MKSWIKYLLFIVFLVLTAAASFLFINLSYKGDKTVILLDAGQAYTSFKKIITRPEFKNKVIYVDVWGTSCPPCFEEMKNYTPQLTAHYNDTADIAFLYICIDRQPLPALRWKQKLQLLKPAGYHVLVTAT